MKTKEQIKTELLMSIERLDVLGLLRLLDFSKALEERNNKDK